MSEIDFTPGSLVPDHVEVYEDDHGMYAYDPEGHRVEVEYVDGEEDAGDQDFQAIAQDLELTVPEQDILQVFIKNNDGNIAAALEDYDFYETKVAERFGLEADQNEDGSL